MKCRLRSCVMSGTQHNKNMSILNCHRKLAHALSCTTKVINLEISLVIYLYVHACIAIALSKIPTEAAKLLN